MNLKDVFFTGFSPRNGEVILKLSVYRETKKADGFSPRNGEVILKLNNTRFPKVHRQFQSPQWGSNSKGYLLETA